MLAAAAALGIPAAITCLPLAIAACGIITAAWRRERRDPRRRLIAGEKAAADPRLPAASTTPGPVPAPSGVVPAA